MLNDCTLILLLLLVYCIFHALRNICLYCIYVCTVYMYLLYTVISLLAAAAVALFRVYLDATFKRKYHMELYLGMKLTFVLLSLVFKIL